MNSPEEIRLIIVDDHQMFIDGIRLLLRKEKQLKIVGEALNGQAAFNLVKNHAVDLVITDINMPKLNGVELTRKIKADCPEVKVLVLSMYNDRETVTDILLAEAEGYILKNTGKSELMRAIERIIAGETHYSSEVLSIMMQRVQKQQRIDAETKDLTPRELEIINLIVQEFSTAQIADQLSISPRTVDTHRKNIMVKTNSKTLVGLIKYAFRNDLVR